MWMIICHGLKQRVENYQSSLYFALETGCPSLFLSSCIWNVNVQPKISFFAWEGMWGKALTLDMVQKRGQALANRCFMCLEKEETIDRPSSPTLLKNKGFMGFTIYFILSVLDVAFFN